MLIERLEITEQLLLLPATFQFRLLHQNHRDKISVRVRYKTTYKKIKIKFSQIPMHRKATNNVCVYV